MNYPQLVGAWEEHLRKGQFHSIGRLLSEREFAVEPVPRSWALPIAKLLRRSRMEQSGLKLLLPLVRATGVAGQATDSEIIEYCQQLQVIGAGNEAQFRLSRIDEQKTPEVLLQRAAQYVSQWNYREAIPLIERYLSVAHNGIGSDVYQNTIVRVNLAAALVFVDDYDRAKRLIQELMEICSVNGWKRLLVNCYEFLVQMAYHQGHLELAQKTLEEALAVEVSDTTVDKLLLKKWSALIAAKISGAFSELESVKQQAQAQQSWETLRDIEFQSLKIQPSQAKIDRLYYGTSHFEYREKIRAAFPAVSDSYFINGRTQHCIDLENGQVDGQDALNPGKKVHQLLVALTCDFVRPIRIGTLFNQLYPHENFDPVASNNRVHQVISKARKQFEVLGIQGTIVEDENIYKIATHETWSIKKSMDVVRIDSTSVALRKLQQSFGGASFVTKDVIRILGLAPTSSFRLLKHLETEGVVEKIGQGKQTRFQLK